MLAGCRQEDFAGTNVASKPGAGPLSLAEVQSGKLMLHTVPQNVGVAGAINAFFDVPGPTPIAGT